MAAAARLAIFSLCMVSAIVGSVTAARSVPGTTGATPAPTSGSNETTTGGAAGPSVLLSAPMLADTKVDKATLEKIASWTPNTVQFMKDHPDLVPVSAPEMAEIEQLVKDPNNLMQIAQGVANYLSYLQQESKVPQAGP